MVVKFHGIIYKIGVALIFLGFILFAIFGILGLARVGIFIIFPFIISNSALSIIPFILIFIGFLLMFVSPFGDIKQSKEYYGNGNNYSGEFSRNTENSQEKNEKHFGGMIMIGPIPIIFGNDKKLVYISIIAAIIIILLYVLFIYRFL